jgi:PEGA domain
MSRVIAFVACGFTLAACSASMPSLDFLKSSPATETLRIESEPPGADAKTTQGQTCRTPCELTVQGGGDLSVTVALNGYQPQTVALRSDQAEGKLSPNPLYVELQAAATPAPAKKKALKKKKPATAAATQSAPAPAPATAAFPPPPASTEPTSSANYPWPTTR